MRQTRAGVGLVILLSAMVFLAAGGTMSDIILVNARVWTGNPGLPWAEAVAVRGDRILAVGTDKDVRRTAAPGAEILDFKGGLILPGFNDSHTHFLSGGFALLSIQLRDARSREEFVSRVAAKARTLGKGTWIVNGDWDHTPFTPVELPRREWIDAVTPDNPVFVNRMDAHMCLANSLALKIAGITRDTPVPPGGEILKDPETGEPTGILKDAAMALVNRHIPEPTLKEKVAAAEAALSRAARYGLTSVTDMADISTFEVYEELSRRGRLTSRLTVYIPVTDAGLFERLKLKTPAVGTMLKLAGLKGFVDGSLGSATALFFEPYTDSPETRGLFADQMRPDGIMEKRIAAADRAGRQVAIHAIGDRANAVLLDIFERTITADGPRDRRWRIEHAQHLRPSDMARFGRMGIIASVQPYHASDDGRWAEKKIGPARVKTTYAFRSLIDHGAVLACGSDWTVAPLDPLTGISAAVTRRTIDGRNPGGWIPEQKITLEEAVRGYTVNGAFAEFEDQEKGTLESGKLADIVVLDEDIFSRGPDRILQARCLMTMVGGRIVYQVGRTHSKS
jgi:predicted amidohydrolase YtcJ